MKTLFFICLIAMAGCSKVSQLQQCKDGRLYQTDIWGSAASAELKDNCAVDVEKITVIEKIVDQSGNEVIPRHPPELNVIELPPEQPTDDVLRP